MIILVLVSSNWEKDCSFLSFVPLFILSETHFSFLGLRYLLSHIYLKRVVIKLQPLNINHMILILTKLLLF